ncbi:YceI family protein [Legionella bononiensis]|uniref:Polyisoprenoid-binding protein n=1 Tax=Legionella bononiensis TaxID=2793102 RepID=A0ABS1WCD2_9GAMM|nr:YceI family protein [Legionella bononiensis]MBL7478885.1 polyisoprenoid-binding protein [Legionella bononiensis]MBL7527016.1 polyisoprenoid-binding protein [Legionella bononiensis]MBL7562391.1 polyisoprenoid-binding protein [Legionella bononiensis]
MKRYLSSLILSILSMWTCFNVAYAAPETFTLDNQHTYILWTIKHLGFSTQAGKWYASGELVLDKEHPDQSKVNVTVNVADVVTGIPELDKHLKGKLFFDVAQFPKATFVSNKVDVLSDTTAKVEGTLTLHGVSKPLTLDVTLNKVGVNPINNKNTVGFTATGTIKRSDFGINTLLPDLGDEVTLQIGAEAYQDKK